MRAITQQWLDFAKADLKKNSSYGRLKKNILFACILAESQCHSAGMPILYK